ncbi:MAG: ATP-binding protein [Nitrospirae bacterium]|nr:ATP-binding protein [Nitrospirota bacterium]
MLRRGKEYYSYKTKDGKEVDFAVKEGLSIIQLIQVCYDIEKLTTKRRELSVLTKAAGETSCDNLLVITWDYENKESLEREDIIYMPLWKWLIK